MHALEAIGAAKTGSPLAAGALGLVLGGAADGSGAVGGVPDDVPDGAFVGALDDVVGKAATAPMTAVIGHVELPWSP